jgi:ABC-2 type transport system ATP-binding protein
MPTVVVDHLSKNFGKLTAVDDVTFSVEQGEIFGLLGPNGAGKTTTIRLILDIFKPDQGQIAIFGGSMDEKKKNRIGYMPEERGLYRDITLDRCLGYLGSLKGLSSAEVRRRSEPYLERFDLLGVRQKKVSELSKGMQQKAQIIVTLLHKPELIIIDEPFAGLDPVNTRLVKDLLLELRTNNVTIIMSTHMMHQVEELCDRLVLIDHGRVLLYGDLSEIRRGFSGNTIVLRAAGELPDLPGTAIVEQRNGTTRLKMAPGTTPQAVLRMLVQHQVAIEKFEIAIPTLDEIFVRVVGQAGERG